MGRYQDFDRQYAWLAARDGRDDPRSWAAAVAGVSRLAATLGRTSFLDLAARAEPLLDPEDLGSRFHLRFFQAVWTALTTGDLTDVTDLLDTAQRIGDDHATRNYASLLCSACANTGRIDLMDRAIAIVRRLLARRGLPFAHHTALEMVGMDAFAAMWRGDLDRARTVADTPGQPDAPMILASSAYAAMVGYATGDIDLLDRLAGWQATAEQGLAAEVRATGEPANLEGPARHVHWTRALLEGRVDDAVPLLRFAHARCPASPALRSYLLVPLATQLLAAGERQELDELIETFAADLGRISDAPLPTTDLHYLRAVLARADGDLDRARNEAYRALDVAEPAHLRLRAIDDVHLLGVLAYQRGQVATAARLLGAVSAERERASATSPVNSPTAQRSTPSKPTSACPNRRRGQKARRWRSPMPSSTHGDPEVGDQFDRRLGEGVRPIFGDVGSPQSPRRWRSEVRRGPKIHLPRKSAASSLVASQVAAAAVASGDSAP